MAVDLEIPGASVGDEPGRSKEKEGQKTPEEGESRPDESFVSQEDLDAVVQELGPDASEEEIREAVAAATTERLEREKVQVMDEALGEIHEATEDTVERKIEEGLDIELGEDSDLDTDADTEADTGADADVQLTPEEQAALDAAKKAANAAAGGGAIAGALGWISDNLKKVFAWISEKISGLFGKLGFKKKEEEPEEEEAVAMVRKGRERHVSGEDIAALAVDIANGQADPVELPADNQSCWGWVYAVYEEAGFSLGDTPILYRDLEGKGDKFGGFDMLKPGDHIIYHNENRFDGQGNHSGIFIEWLDKGARRARVANYSGGSSGRVKIDEVDFTQDEVRGVRQPEDKEQEHYQDFEMLDPAAPVFTFPADSGVHFSSNYGWRVHPIHGDWRFHKGIDLGAPEGTPVVCTQDNCEVISSGFYGGAGNMVQLKIPGAGEPKFMHFMKLGPPVGTILNRGDIIGYVGDTGASDGAHLHFEIEKDGAIVDPNPYISESVRAVELERRAQRQAEYDASPMA